MIDLPFSLLKEKCQRPALDAELTPWFGPELSLRSDTAAMLSRHSGSRRRVLEIGSWLGYSALRIAEANPEATVICIDTWLGSVDLHEMPSMRPLIWSSYEQFLANTETLQERIWALRIDSVNGMALCYECGVRPDLIFIDGGHQYESIWADLHIARRLFPQADLVLDDLDHPGVRQAALELIPSLTIEGIAGYFRGTS